MRAFLDESFHESKGMYVVAAVMIAVANEDLARHAMRGLLLPGQERVHFSKEGYPRRLEILETIADLELMACVVSHNGAKQDRARAICLRGILWDLREAEVTDLVIESRQARNDQKDRRLVIAAQKAGEAPGRLRYSFGRPKAEPLLWLPDAVAGAWSSGDARYSELLAGIVVSQRDVP